MKKIIAFLLLLSLVSLAAVACEEESESEDTPADDRFVMSATVTELGDKILVEVTESEYATGAYLVILSDSVSITDPKGKQKSKDDIALGDTLKITYTGQVTMSIPPQIIAVQIVIL